MRVKKISFKLLIVILVFGLTVSSLAGGIISFAQETEADTTTENSLTTTSTRDPLSDLISPTSESSEGIQPMLTEESSSESVDVEEQENSQEEPEEEAVEPLEIETRENGAVSVTDWQSFVKALGNEFVSKITIQNDITLSGVLANYDDLFDKQSVNEGSGFVYLFVKKTVSRSLVIDGGGYTFDFGNLAIGFNNASLVRNKDWQITLQNIAVKSKNYHGPFFYPRIAVNESSSSGLNTRLKNQQLNFGKNYQHTRYVKNYLEYVTAMNTISVDRVELIADIIAEGRIRLDVQIANIENGGEFPTTIREYAPNSGGETFMYQEAKGTARKIYVEGNGYTWDQGSMVWCYYDPTTRDASNVLGGRVWDITFANMNTYHVNFWGIAEFWDLSPGPESDARITYHNFSNRGSQLIESQSSRVDLSGEIDVRQVETYESVRKDGTIIRRWNTNNRRNQTISVAATTIYPDSKVYLSSLAGTTLHLREAGDLVIGENAQVELVRQGWQGNSSQEGEAAVIDISKGNLIVKKGAVVNATSKDNTYGTVLYTGASNATLQIDKNATLNAKVENYQRNETTQRNPIRMVGGKINVEGTLNLEGTNMGASKTHMLYSPNAVNFTVATGGSFNLTSDSTSSDQALMYFNNRNSTFQFSDAQRVNLQRTKAIGSTSSLIYMASGGTLDVSVQNVYQWLAGNLTGGQSADEGGMDFKYEPMSNMVLTFAGNSLSKKTGNSMFEETKELFQKNFAIRGQQRILFEYVPAPSIEIKSVANDNPQEPESITIHGYARPNTYIRLWEEAKNGTISALVKGTEDEIKTPITDPNFDINAIDGQGNPMYTDDPTKNYTVIADVNGDWRYTIAGKDRQHFTANNIIHAFGFNNLKSEEPTQIVLDKTAPTGTAVTYYAVKGDPILAPNIFIKDAHDTNPVLAEAKINYAYNRETDIAALMNLVSTEKNPHKVMIDVSDSATHPVTGEGMANTVTITADLVVLATPVTIDLAAEDLVVEYKELRELTDEELKAWVLQKSGATGYKVDRGGIVDLTEAIIVSDLGQLNDINEIVAADGNMTVTLAILKEASGMAEDYTASVKVKVINLLATLTVEFVNEANESLEGYTLVLTEKDGEKLVVSDKVDLTDNQYGVTQQIAKLEMAGYEVVMRPTNENAFELNNIEVKATYQLKGLVYIASKPETIDFGKVRFDGTVQQIDEGQRDGDLVVNDTRITKTNWVLGAKILTQMTNDTNQSVTLVDGLQYFYGEEKVILNEGLQKIYHENDSAQKEIKVTNISETWGKTKDSDGIKLIIDPSKAPILKGTYRGVIEWEFMQGEP